MEINEDHLNENKQKLLLQSLQKAGSQPPSLASGWDSKAGRGMGKLYNEKKEKALGVLWLEAVGLGEAGGGAS